MAQDSVATGTPAEPQIAHNGVRHPHARTLPAQTSGARQWLRKFLGDDRPPCLRAGFRCVCGTSTPTERCRSCVCVGMSVAHPGDNRAEAPCLLAVELFQIEHQDAAARPSQVQYQRAERAFALPFLAAARLAVQDAPGARGASGAGVLLCRFQCPDVTIEAWLRPPVNYEVADDFGGWAGVLRS